MILQLKFSSRNLRNTEVEIAGGSWVTRFSSLRPSIVKIIVFKEYKSKHFGTGF